MILAQSLSWGGSQDVSRGCSHRNTWLGLDPIPRWLTHKAGQEPAVGRGSTSLCGAAWVPLPHGLWLPPKWMNQKRTGRKKTMMTVMAWSLPSHFCHILLVESKSPGLAPAEGSIFSRWYFEEFVDTFYTNLPMPYILTQSGKGERGRSCCRGKNNLLDVEDLAWVPALPCTSWRLLENHQCSELCGQYSFPTDCKEPYRKLRVMFVKTYLYITRCRLLPLFYLGWLCVWLRETVAVKFLLTQAFPLPLWAESNLRSFLITLECRSRSFYPVLLQHQAFRSWEEFTGLDLLVTYPFLSNSRALFETFHTGCSPLFRRNTLKASISKIK